MTTTRAPDSAARVAAAIPAGPPPTTATSHVIVRVATTSPLMIAPLPRRLDDHPRRARQETRPLMRLAIHRHATLEADAHTADRRAGLTGHRSAEGAHSGIEECHGKRSPFRNEEALSIHQDLHATGHRLKTPHRCRSRT